MADRTSLSRATESSDAPTPGYLYLDIARAAASSPIACRDTAQYLLRRLQTKQNYNIKYKCLKVLQKTAESPLTRGQFKRDICQDPNAIGAIKDALQFRGPPDPVRGDSMYEKVRNAAKDCLEAVYADQSAGAVEVSGSSMNAGLAGGITSSYGNSVAARGGGGGFGGSPMGGYAGAAPPAASGMGGGGPGAMGARKMEGIGNPMFKDPRMDENQRKGLGRMTIGDVATAVGSTVKGMIKDPLARNVTPSHSMPSVTVNHSHRIGNLPGYGGSAPSNGGGASMYGGYGAGGGGGGGYHQSQPPGARELAQQTGGAWTMASNRGINAIQNVNGATAAHAPSGVGGSWASSGPSIASQARTSGGHVASAVPISGPGAYQNSGTAASDGTYERNLISELCPPGGMRPEPPEDKLLKFAQSVPSLNADLVCPVLLDALEDGQPWIIKAKTLCVIEKTIQSAIDSLGEQNPYSDFFHTCAGEVEPLCSHARPAVRDPAKRVLRALGLAVPTTKAPVPPSAPVPPPVEAPAPPPAPAPVNLLDFGEEDTFGSTPVVAPTPVPNEVPPPPPDVPPPPAPPSVPSGGASLFGGLNINSSTTTSAIPTSEPAPAPPSGSAFGFISASSATPETSNPPVPAAPPAPVPKLEDELLSLSAPSTTTTMNPPPSSTTFDPLLALGNSSTALPGTAVPPPPMASVSPTMSNKQMQNLSYQQNMLMMQHQMQQMQMAMAMQQQQSSNTKHASVMQPHSSYIPDMNMMQPVGTSIMGKGQQFSILESAKKEEDQKSFDFIKDTMKGAK